MNERAAQAVREFLEALGVDLEAEGMQRTPERVTRMFELLFSGRGRETKTIWGETFETDSGGIVAVQHIPFFSVCEHHLMPFFGEVGIAYLPHYGRVAGFSKFSRIVETLARRPQLQERLTREIAVEIERGLEADGVMVVVSAQQLCMMVRGELALGTRTVTVEALGAMGGGERFYEQAWRLLTEGRR